MHQPFLPEKKKKVCFFALTAKASLDKQSSVSHTDKLRRNRWCGPVPHTASHRSVTGCGDSRGGGKIKKWRNGTHPCVHCTWLSAFKLCVLYPKRWAGTTGRSTTSREPCTYKPDEIRGHVWTAIGSVNQEYPKPGHLAGVSPTHFTRHWTAVPRRFPPALHSNGKR